MDTTPLDLAPGIASRSAETGVTHGHLVLFGRCTRANGEPFRYGQGWQIGSLPAGMWHEQFIRSYAITAELLGQPVQAKLDIMPDGTLRAAAGCDVDSFILSCVTAELPQPTPV